MKETNFSVKGHVDIILYDEGGNVKEKHGGDNAIDPNWTKHMANWARTTGGGQYNNYTSDNSANLYGQSGATTTDTHPWACDHMTPTSPTLKTPLTGGALVIPRILLATNNVDIGGTTAIHKVICKTLGTFTPDAVNPLKLQFTAEASKLHNATVTFANAYLERSYDWNPTTHATSSPQAIASYDINPDIAVGTGDTLSVTWTITLSAA